MVGRRLLRADLGYVTIGAAVGLLKLHELFFDSRNFRIGRLLVVLMTSSARSDRNVGSQSTQRPGPRNIDVAGRAFHHVFTFAAFVTEHC